MSTILTTRVFIPHLERSEVAVPAPGSGEGFWAGASSAVEHEGMMYLAVRLRAPIGQGRGLATAVMRSADGVHFEMLQTITKEEMEAESLERPALVRMGDGKWRLYLSCATRGTKHWRVELLEAGEPGQFVAAERRVVLAGDERWGVKDPVIRRHDGKWHLWASCHRLETPGHEDRMVTNYATSDDGVAWTWRGTALDVRPGKWDSRGVRVTSVQFMGDMVMAFYDGRASAEENYEERTGVAGGPGLGSLSAIGDEPVAQSADGRGLRYLDVVPLGDGHYRLFYEVRRADGAHELRTELR